MLYNSLLSIVAFLFCLSLFLVHRASVLENDFRKLQGDLILQLNQPRSEGVNGKMAKTSETREDIKPSAFQKAQSSLKMSFMREKREEGRCRAPTFLQLTACTNKQPDIRGNITVIYWTVAAQQGNAISQKENRIFVQEDGYYLVFGQVLSLNSSITKLILRLICSSFSSHALLNSQVTFKSPSTVVGHIIRSWSSTETTSTELLRCLQEVPADAHPTNTCYTAGQ
ncbi:tumor necrosis factor ligand superfamily member 13B-like isoform X1 [Solea senegalensis]|uniref:Tumor necrosis factor ligand superfamily member 13B-like isoform X1 n=1 Tax=Solea senegalensis TaxID=28829 RepID=A0AAV6SJ33_SOLSE|nr:tumor necrosis factor ligand superfamily member 13B-like isoform X1 [Solea senegalensis]